GAGRVLTARPPDGSSVRALSSPAAGDATIAPRPRPAPPPAPGGGAAPARPPPVARRPPPPAPPPSRPSRGHPQPAAPRPRAAPPLSRDRQGKSESTMIEPPLSSVQRMNAPLAAPPFCCTHRQV